jgi:hypothetical protein
MSSISSTSTTFFFFPLIVRASLLKALEDDLYVTSDAIEAVKAMVLEDSTLVSGTDSTAEISWMIFERLPDSEDVYQHQRVPSTT